MKFSIFHRPFPGYAAMVLAVLALGPWASAQTVVSLRSTRAETREPLCDPAVCDAPVPAPGVFVVSRDGGDLSRELPVFLEYSGSADPGSDFEALPTLALIPAGQRSVELFVHAAFDRRSEGDEDVIAMVAPDPSLGPIPRYVINSAQSRARVVIHDNEVSPVSVVRIDAVDRVAEETSAPLRRLALRGRFVISRTGPTAEALPVFVHYRGSATPGVDYPAQPFLVAIPAGTNALEIEIVPKPDDIAEPIEIVEATLSECPPETIPPLGVPCYQVNIDPAHATARVFIRDDGITTATIEITQPRAGAEFPFGRPVPVNATAIDLDGAITRLEFFAGATSIGTSEIVFVRAPDPGDPILHSVVWDNPPVGRHLLTARGVNAAGERVVSPAVPIVVVGDSLPVISIEATAPETTEPSPTSRIAPAVFTLSRSGPTDRPLRVLTQNGGTATPDADYAAVPRGVEFPAGTSSVQVVIVPLDDDLVEGDETVITEILPSLVADVPSYRIDPLRARARVVIHDNDRPTVPVVSIVATQPVTSEGCPTCLVAPGVFTLKRVGGDLSSPLGISLRTGGTATPGVDYEMLPEFAVIPAGSETYELRVLPRYDTVFEGDETVTVQVLPDPSMGPIERYRVDPAQANARVVIHDSPTTLAEVSIVAIDPFAREGANAAGEVNTATFSVRRRGPTNDVLEVALDFGGTARPGADYEVVPSVARIPAGQRSVRLTLRPVDDRVPEPLETVLVTLRPPVASLNSLAKYTLGVPSRAAALIVDNDRERPLCLRLPDGLFNVCVPEKTNGCFRVEASLGLDRWTPLCELPVNEGAVHFVDPDAAQFPRRFYRLVPVDCEPEE